MVLLWTIGFVTNLPLTNVKLSSFNGNHNSGKRLEFNDFNLALINIPIKSM